MSRILIYAVNVLDIGRTALRLLHPSSDQYRRSRVTFVRPENYEGFIAVSTLHDRLGALQPGQNLGRVRLSTGNWRQTMEPHVETILMTTVGMLTLGSSTLMVWTVMTAAFGA